VLEQTEPGNVGHIGVHDHGIEVATGEQLQRVPPPVCHGGIESGMVHHAFEKPEHDR